MLRSRCRYQDLGEKPSEYFFNFENRNFTNKVMTKLIEEDDSEYYETKDVLNCQRKFLISYTVNQMKYEVTIPLKV